jgi:hypothetical protein
VDAWQVNGTNRTAITAAGNQSAGTIVFSVEVVTPDSTTGVEKLSVDVSDLRRRTAPGVSAGILTVADGGRPVSEIQKLVRLDAVKAGSSFSLTFNGATSAETAYTTSAIQSAYDGLAPAAGFAQVIGSDANTWYVTFSGAAGINQPLSGMVTANASQLAQEVSVSDLLSGRFGNTPSATGFTGVIQNMSNITYGGGLNLLLGSNVALYEALLSKNTSVSSQNSLFGDGSFSLGRNVFEVGGNALSGFFTDGRTGDGRYDGNNTQDVFKFLTDTLSSTFINGQLSFGEPVLAPGVHLMSGMTGGDTYKFNGFWGVAAVIEPPSVYAGVDLNFGFDTLDFNAVNSDLTFDIYTLTTDNISGWQERLNALGHPMPLSLGMNLVLARNNAGTKLIEQFGDLLGSTISFGEFGLNYVLATGIENIIGGSGKNTFKFHGAARIDGFLSDFARLQ